MAKWSEVKRYLSNNYKISSQDQDWLKLEFETNNERSQLVFVEKKESNTGMEWIEISSPIGAIDQYEIPDILYDSVVRFGEVVMENDGLLWLRHAIKAESLSYDELELAMSYITEIADSIEERFIGGDKY